MSIAISREATNIAHETWSKTKWNWYIKRWKLKLFLYGVEKCMVISFAAQHIILPVMAFDAGKKFCMNILSLNRPKPFLIWLLV